MTILAMVNAEKEGQIESRMMKGRHMEEIREARKKEAAARQEQRKSKLVSNLIHGLLLSLSIPYKMWTSFPPFNFERTFLAPHVANFSKTGGSQGLP